MIEQHSALACGLAERLGLDEATQEAVAASYERWDGRGWPGRLRGEEIPLASRICQLAEYVEVAYRVGGVAAATALARDRSGGHFDPELVSVLVAEATTVFGDLDATQTWVTVIEAEPALRRRLEGDEVDRALEAVADFVDLKSPRTPLATHEAWLTWLHAPAESSGCPPRMLPPCTAPRWSTTSAGWACPTRSGTSPAPSALASGNGSGCTRTSPNACCASHPRWRPSARSRSNTERLDGSGYPRGLTGGSLSTMSRTLAAADASGQCGNHGPIASRFPRTPRPTVCAASHEPGASMSRWSRRCSPPPATTPVDTADRPDCSHARWRFSDSSHEVCRAARSPGASPCRPRRCATTPNTSTPKPAPPTVSRQASSPSSTACCRSSEVTSPFRGISDRLTRSSRRSVAVVVFVAVPYARDPDSWAWVRPRPVMHAAGT